MNNNEINSTRFTDIDQDGDINIIASSRANSNIFLHENFGNGILDSIDVNIQIILLMEALHLQGYLI